MKKFIKGLCLAIACTTLVSGFAGCAKENTGSTAAEAKADFPLKTPITLNVWGFAVNGVVPKYLKTMADSDFYKTISAKTNVKLVFTSPAQGQEQDQFNIMVSSGAYPDLIEGVGGLYSGGGDKAIQDGVILKLNDLIDKYAPHYKKLLDSSPTIKKDLVSDSGNMYAFGEINQGEAEGPWAGPTVRQDWLDELGLKTPVTYDDWHTMLVAFKEKKGATMPLTIGSKGLMDYDNFCGGFGFDTGMWFQVNGKVRYSPLEPGYKQYITTMHQWYSEGLIDRDFAGNTTFDATLKKFTSKNCGAFVSAQAMWPVYTAQAKVSQPKYHLVAVPNPVQKVGDKVHIRLSNPIANTGDGFSISKSCKNPEIAAKFLDYMYTDEMTLAANYGTLGKTYDMVNGKPKLRDIMTQSNPKGMSLVEVNAVYGLNNGSFFKDWKKNYTGNTADQLNSMKIWEAADDSYVMPPITLTSDEGTQYSSIMSDLNTFVQENTIKFIIGGESLSSYDAFIKKIKSMNIDQANSLEQAALDRYEARK